MESLMRVLLLAASCFSLVLFSGCNSSSSESEEPAAEESEGPSVEDICTNIQQYEHEFTSDLEEDCSGFIAEVIRECGQPMVDCFATAESGEAVDACEDLCE
jgi:hypothetical protein